MIKFSHESLLDLSIDILSIRLIVTVEIFLD